MVDSTGPLFTKLHKCQGHTDRLQKPPWEPCKFFHKKTSDDGL